MKTHEALTQRLIISLWVAMILTVAVLAWFTWFWISWKSGFPPVLDLALLLVFYLPFFGALAWIGLTLSSWILEFAACMIREDRWEAMLVEEEKSAAALPVTMITPEQSSDLKEAMRDSVYRKSAP